MSVSFGEIALVVLIALLVVKPEQLPEVALMAGRLFKSSRRFLNTMKGNMNQLIDSIEQTNERK